MEPDYTPREVHGPDNGNFWYDHTGHNSKGEAVTVNYFADSIDKAEALAHAANISHGLSTSNKVSYIGTKSDYESFDE